MHEDPKRSLIWTDWYRTHKGEVRLRIEAVVWSGHARFEVWQNASWFFESPRLVYKNFSKCRKVGGLSAELIDSAQIAKTIYIISVGIQTTKKYPATIIINPNNSIATAGVERFTNAIGSPRNAPKIAKNLLRYP